MNFVRVPKEPGDSTDKIINLDRVEMIELTGSDCYVRFRSGAEEYISGVTAEPFFADCIRSVFGHGKE